MFGAAAMEAREPLAGGDRDDQTPTSSEMDASGTDGSSDTSSIDQNSNPPNAIEALLDAALAAHSQLDAIVAGWSVLEEFWTVSERYPTASIPCDECSSVVPIVSSKILCSI